MWVHSDEGGLVAKYRTKEQVVEVDAFWYGGPNDVAGLRRFVGPDARVYTDPLSSAVWLAGDHDEGILVHYERWVIKQPGPREDGSVDHWMEGWHSSWFRFLSMWDRDFKEQLELVAE